MSKKKKHYKSLSLMIKMVTDAYQDRLDSNNQPLILEYIKTMMLVRTRFANEEYIDLMAISIAQNALRETDLSLDDFKSAGFNERILSALITLDKNQGLDSLELHTDAHKARISFYEGRSKNSYFNIYNCCKTESAENGRMLSRMIALASKHHYGQFDRGDVSYILHPIRVMLAVDLRHPMDFELLMIAIAHDLLEDSDLTKEDLYEMGFSKRVVEALDLMDHKKGVPYKTYILALSENEDAVICKLGDLGDNSQISRLKGIRKKDIIRMFKYHTCYLFLSGKMDRQVFVETDLDNPSWNFEESTTSKLTDLQSQLLEKTMKPDEINGDKKIKEQRIKELVSWMARFNQGHANPKWLAQHATELAFYIAQEKGL